jgi:Domain of unknown function (DUF1996)
VKPRQKTGIAMAAVALAILVNAPRSALAQRANVNSDGAGDATGQAHRSKPAPSSGEIFARKPLFLVQGEADASGVAVPSDKARSGMGLQPLLAGPSTSNTYGNRLSSAHHDGSDLPYINNALIPRRSIISFNKELVRPTTEEPTVSDVGAFRISCSYSHMSYDDPIVFPGEPGRAHLHTFFGNTGTDAYSTASSLLTTGNSTCTGGTINRSAYWIPSLIRTTNGAPLAPTDALFYYKGVGVPNIQPMPNGLRMIAGDARATTPPPQFSSHYRFHCERADFSSYSYGFVIPNCPAGDSIALELWFPVCWDGVNLDSADHKSHMAYSQNSACPTSHPVVLPQITFNVSWRVPVGATGSEYRLSSDGYPATTPGGYSMHGDWFMGWKPEVRDVWTNGCLRALRDCHAHLTGGGQEMYRETVVPPTPQLCLVQHSISGNGCFEPKPRTTPRIEKLNTAYAQHLAWYLNRKNDE